MALRLGELGFRSTFALAGGFDGWQDLGLPVEAVRRGDPGQNAVLHQPM